MLFDTFVKFVFLYTVLDKFDVYVWGMMLCCVLSTTA